MTISCTYANQTGFIPLRKLVSAASRPNHINLILPFRCKWAQFMLDVRLAKLNYSIYIISGVDHVEQNRNS